MNASDLDVVAPMVVDYLRFLTGKGGRSREELLVCPLTRSQHAMLLERLDDTDYLWRVTHGNSPRAKTVVAGRVTAASG